MFNRNYAVVVNHQTSEVEIVEVPQELRKYRGMSLGAAKRLKGKILVSGYNYSADKSMFSEAPNE